MREEYAQVLIPNTDLQGDKNKNLYTISSSETRKGRCDSLKWLVIFLIIFTCALTAVTTVFVTRYEEKVQEYGYRISEVEQDLETFFQVLSEELDYDKKSGSKGPGTEIELILPQIEKNPQQDIKSRRKRQTEFPNLPNSFGPEVARTEDGVPIVDRSYQVSPNTNTRAGLRRFDSIVAAQPTPDSEGLRLYEGLVETGGRNEPKSSNFEDTRGLNSLQPHHKVSAAWSEKDEIASRPSGGLQLKSLGDSDLGIFDERYGGPRYANSMTYSKSGSTQRRPATRARQTSNTATYVPSNSFVRTSGVPAGATFHRNSRVASTQGVDNSYFGAPVSNNVYSSNRRRIYTGRRNSRVEQQYPPLRKLSLGDGQGEVIARVIQDTEEDHQQPYQHRQQQRQWRGERKMGSFRGGRQQEYLSRRPVETQRPPVLPTDNPAGYTETEGRLNVTINKSPPFRTYYSSSGGNWEINTQPPRNSYRNNY